MRELSFSVGVKDKVNVQIHILNKQEVLHIEGILRAYRKHVKSKLSVYQKDSWLISLQYHCL